MSEVCNHCGQRIQQAHKETMSRQKLTMLKAVAQHVIDTDSNDFKKSSVSTMQGNTAYANFQKLRYHGLIAHVTINGQRVRDRWLVTRNGWAFLRGELSLPKYVLVKNNHITTRSDLLISVRDVYYGSEAIQTTFEYFDDYGNKVGFAPVRRYIEDRQVRLV